MPSASDAQDDGSGELHRGGDQHLFERFLLQIVLSAIIKFVNNWDPASRGEMIARASIVGFAELSSLVLAVMLFAGAVAVLVGSRWGYVLHRIFAIGKLPVAVCCGLGWVVLMWD